MLGQLRIGVGTGEGWIVLCVGRLDHEWALYHDVVRHCLSGLAEFGMTVGYVLARSYLGLSRTCYKRRRESFYALNFIPRIAE